MLSTVLRGRDIPFARDGRRYPWRFVLTGALLTAALAYAPAASGSSGATTATAQSSFGSVTITVGDASFDGAQARIPIHFSYEKTHPVAWTRTAIDIGPGDIIARQPGSRDTIFGGFRSVQRWGIGSAKSGTGSSEIIIPGELFVPGVPVLIYGSADFIDGTTAENKREYVAFSPVLQVNVSQQQSTLRDLRMTDGRITGRATVNSSVGVTGTSGFVTVRYQKPGSTQWERVQRFWRCPVGSCQIVNTQGGFDLTPIKPIPRGSLVEIRLRDCRWCTDATATVRAD